MVDNPDPGGGPLVDPGTSNALNERSDWNVVGDSEGKRKKECFNCHEVGHLRQNCTNRKRIKCFNCEKLGHTQKDCIEPAVVRQKVDATPGWRDSDTARKLVASRTAQSSSGMTVVQAYLVIEDGKMWKVTRELGLKILDILGLEIASVVGQNKDVKGIQSRGSKVEFWLSPNADVERFLLEDVMILLEDGISLTAIREVGKRTKKVRYKNVPFHVDNREIVSFSEKVGKVLGPVTWVKDETLDVFTGERCIEIEFNACSYIPSKVILSGTEVSVWYPGQQRTCFSCHKFVALCNSRGNANKCRGVGDNIRLEQAVSKYFEEIGYAVHVGSVEEEDGCFDPVVNLSPIKKKGSSDNLMQAGVVVKRKAGLDKDKLLESIAAVMSSLPQELRESPQILERKNSFVVELEHKCAVLVRRDLEELLGLAVLPLVDAREGLKHVTDEDETEESPPDSVANQLIDK